MEPKFTTYTVYTNDEYSRFTSVIYSPLIIFLTVIFLLYNTTASIAYYFMALSSEQKPDIPDVELVIASNIALTWLSNVIVFFLILLLMYIIISFISSLSYKSDKLAFNSNNKYEFYDDYFINSDHFSKAKIGYEYIYKIKETKTNFYIFVSSTRAYILNKSTFPTGLDVYLRDLKVTLKKQKKSKD